MFCQKRKVSVSKEEKTIFSLVTIGTDVKSIRKSLIITIIHPIRFK